MKQNDFLFDKINKDEDKDTRPKPQTPPAGPQFPKGKGK